MIEHSIGVISGQNDVAQGNVPQGVTAASAIAQLMEANDTMLGPDVRTSPTRCWTPARNCCGACAGSRRTTG
jgi:hypothetical protein